jgi:hypothetical protein
MTFAQQLPDHADRQKCREHRGEENSSNDSILKGDNVILHGGLA